MVFVKQFKINFLIASALSVGLAAGTTAAHADETLNNDFRTQSSFGNTDTLSAASVSGSSLSSLTTLALSAGHEFNQAVSLHQNKLHSFSKGVGTSPVFFGDAEDPELNARAKKVFDVIGKPFGLTSDDGGSAPQFWSRDYSRKGTVASSNGFNNYNYDLSGFSGGMDVHAGQNWNFGFAAGYAKATSNFEAMSRTGTAVTAYQAALYATYENELGSLDSNVSFNKFENQSERSIIGKDVANTADSKGKGYQLAWTLSAMGNSTYNKFSITPMTGFTFTRLHRGNMNEDGAGLYDLNSSSADSTSFKPMLGVDIARSYTYKSDTTITPEVYGIYRYEVMDANESTNNHLENFDTLSSSSSTNLSRHSMQVGSSLAVKIGDNFTGRMQFDSDIQPSSRSYNGMFRVNYNW